LTTLCKVVLSLRTILPRQTSWCLPTAFRGKMIWGQGLNKKSNVNVNSWRPIYMSCHFQFANDNCIGDQLWFCEASFNCFLSRPPFQCFRGLNKPGIGCGRVWNTWGSLWLGGEGVCFYRFATWCLPTFSIRW
jgi:hypothetical protein